MKRTIQSLALLALLGSLPTVAADKPWQPAQGPLMTRWAKNVSPKNALPEYPRPQMVRKDWQNLNGLWSYAITAKDAAQPAQWDGQILVPFPIESALSGVMKRVYETNQLWYRRTFEIPRGWKGKNVLLHFGAVDWETKVFVNGKEVGAHRGGYDGFSFDITSALNSSGEQEIVVSVFDPTDASTQPRGKQIRNPHGIWYTPTSGIWQTVWLEPVSPAYLQDLKITPNLDDSSVTIQARGLGGNGKTSVKVEVLDGRKVVQEGVIDQMIATRSIPPQIRPSIKLSVPNAKLWSPDAPFLYGLRVTLLENGKKVDELESYFGMRKIAIAKDASGINRLMLNNQPVFQFGPLDQGFWPDGLYTAPTDEALRYDIEMTKKLGFNMARKHVKVEPDRWYYWCDKLGLLVWQDMPSGDKYIGNRDPDITRSPESGADFERELKALVDGRFNHPSIVMWVPYNEGWGQWDTCRIVDLVRQWDPTRLVNNTSGWADRKCGDVMDIHVYPGPGAPRLEEQRAGVLGEYGGLGLPIKGHTWQDEKNWGYRSYKTSEELTEAYIGLINKLRPLTGEQGLSAAVYTQTTDVEVEVNGLMTYDRAMVKMNEAAITAANKSVYTPPQARRSEGTKLVPPATPLVACDPYFSIWSPGDKLNEVDTTHWTGKPHRLTSLARINGKVYRLMGSEPSDIPAAKQVLLEVGPTRTTYGFSVEGVMLSLCFITPALPENLDILSRPVTYIVWEVDAPGSKRPDVAVYFDAAAELAVNEPNQEVVWSEESVEGLTTLKMGSREQAILAKRGDDIRIDWGYLYASAPTRFAPAKAVASRRSSQSAFISNGKLPDKVDSRMPRAASDEFPVMAFAFDFGKVGSTAKSKWLMLAYDDLYSIQYMKKNLRPYWRRNGWEAADLLKASAAEFETLNKRSAAFDAELMADLRKAGGEKYAKIGALAYRQCFAAGKFVADDNGQPLQFCKENHSNGCIGTSDVFYPMAPQFLLLGPTLAKSFIVPFMNYAASERWKFPFAPHDLGQYPHANGQVYGDGERGVNNQMPVEESGNLLLLMAAIAQMEGNANFAGLYWKQVEQWAEYLKEKGFDPENQLCTDDFAGHLAHNVNLSAKAICGLGAFAKMCEMRGETAKAAEYSRLAKEFAAKWVKEADDGEKFRLAFDRPGTWSQKYNLMWDRILGLNLFPDSVLRKEMDYYKKNQNKYGLPLDNRQTYTKLDWITWTATLTQNRADFEALIDPIFTFLNETPDRAPMPDWYQTKSAKKEGFTARPVVGGVFAQMLYDKAVWQKYASRDKTKAANWAPMPKPPKITAVVPAADTQPATWRYTNAKPADDWSKPGFDDSTWKQGQSGFGTPNTPSAVVGTTWNTPDIWLRREVEIPADKLKNLELWVHHDEDAEIFINGVAAGRLRGFATSYFNFAPRGPGLAALKPGKNLLAVHCHQSSGGQYIDLGFVEVTQAVGGQ